MLSHDDAFSSVRWRLVRPDSPNHRRTVCGSYRRAASRLRGKSDFGLTSAGRVNPELRIPGIVIATAAVRDEGTSYHYLPAGSVVEGHGSLAEILAAELQRLPLPLTTGTVWTTDAPYRETKSQLAEHAAAGVSAVEMQAASLFALVPLGMSRSASLPMLRMQSTIPVSHSTKERRSAAMGSFKECVGQPRASAICDSHVEGRALEREGRTSWEVAPIRFNASMTS